MIRLILLHNTMSTSHLQQLCAQITSNPTKFIDSTDTLKPLVESLVSKLRHADPGNQTSGLLDLSIQVISKLKTAGKLVLNVDKNIPVDTSKRLADPRAAVEDRFFKLDELQEFLDDQDRQFEQKDEHPESDAERDDSDDGVDLFADMSDEGDDAMFREFFDAPNEPISGAQSSDSEEDRPPSNEDELIDIEDYNPSESGVTSAVTRDMVVASDSESDDDAVTEEPETPYQKKKRIEEEKIRKLEQETLSAAPWQLTGEVEANHRPSNSLLEEYLQFDFMTRQPPRVTEETTHQIEDIIRQRIKNESWDDVVRKRKPTEEAFEFKRRITLEQEKSKASLAQVYEKEFAKAAGVTEDGKEDPNHIKIKKMLRILYAKLDALSNFHFTPRLPEPELKILNNLPAVTVEEAIPAAVSECTLLAPEEVSRKEKREFMADTEKTDTDRKRERRTKKKFQKAKRLYTTNKQRGSASDPVSKNKYVKLDREQALANALKKLPAEKLADSKNIRSSKSFFEQLDEKVKLAKVGKSGLKKKSTVNAKKLKL